MQQPSSSQQQRPAAKACSMTAAAIRRPGIQKLKRRTLLAAMPFEAVLPVPSFLPASQCSVILCASACQHYDLQKGCCLMRQHGLGIGCNPVFALPPLHCFMFVQVYKVPHFQLVPAAWTYINRDTPFVLSRDFVM
jgi:hypothetical protein